MDGSDSDATVMEEDTQVPSDLENEDQMVSDVVCESPVLTSSPSPSILKPTIQQILQSKRNGPKPNLESESEDLSQELPLQISTSLIAQPQVVASQSVCSSVSHDNASHPITQVRSSQTVPEGIIEEQIELIDHLKKVNKETVAREDNARLKEKQLKIEKNLKIISSNNQTERKTLLEACTSLKQQSKAVPEALKKQLLNLGRKQKQLVECFSRQVEISGLLDKILLPAETTDRRSQIPHQQSSSQDCEDLSSQVTIENTVSSQRAISSEQDNSNSQPLSQRSIAHYSRPQALNKLGPKAAGLGEPVPLNTLIKHGFLKPGKDSLSCQILGCLFKASLLEDGGIQDSNTAVCYLLPGQWLKACWARLGHPQKKIARKLSYTSVMYDNMPLINYCARYSMKQVSSYLSQNSQTPLQPAGPDSHPQQTSEPLLVRQAAVTTSAVAMDTEPPERSQSINKSRNMESPVFDLPTLLANARVWLLPKVHSGCRTSLDLPQGFWTTQETLLPTGELLETIQQDFDCW